MAVVELLALLSALGMTSMQAAFAGGDPEPVSPGAKHLFYDSRPHDPDRIPIEIGGGHQAIARVHLEECADEIEGFLCLCLSERTSDVRSWFLGSDLPWEEADRACARFSKGKGPTPERDGYLRGTPFFRCVASRPPDTPAYRCRCETVRQVGGAARGEPIAEFEPETVGWFLRASGSLTPEEASAACDREGEERFFQTARQAGRATPLPEPACVAGKARRRARADRFETRHYECKAAPLFGSVMPAYPRPR